MFLSATIDEGAEAFVALDPGAREPGHWQVPDPGPRSTLRVASDRPNGGRLFERPDEDRIRQLTA